MSVPGMHVHFTIHLLTLYGKFIAHQRRQPACSLA